MILCLDVALCNTGWAVLTNDGKLRDYGVISTGKSKKSPSVAIDNTLRASEIASELRILFQKYSFNLVAAELPGGGAKSAVAMRSMALAIGAVAASLYMMCQNCSCEIKYTSPRQGKLAVTGDPHADKELIQKRIREIYRQELERLNVSLAASKFEHVADALAAYEVVK